MLEKSICFVRLVYKPFLFTQGTNFEPQAVEVTFSELNKLVKKGH